MIPRGAGGHRSWFSRDADAPCPGFSPGAARGPPGCSRHAPRLPRLRGAALSRRLSFWGPRSPPPASKRTRPSPRQRAALCSRRSWPKRVFPASLTEAVSTTGAAPRRSHRPGRAGGTPGSGPGCGRASGQRGPSVSAFHAHPALGGMLSSVRGRGATEGGARRVGFPRGRGVRTWAGAMSRVRCPRPHPSSRDPAGVLGKRLGFRKRPIFGGHWGIRRAGGAVGRLCGSVRTRRQSGRGAASMAVCQGAELTGSSREFSDGSGQPGSVPLMGGHLRPRFRSCGCVHITPGSTGAGVRADALGAGSPDVPCRRWPHREAGLRSAELPLPPPEARAGG